MRDNRVDELRQDELRELRRLIETIDKHLHGHAAEPADPAPLLGLQRTKPDDPLAFQAAELYRQRRKREAVFGPNGDLLGEPGWDMLLDLFIARRSGRSLSVSASCIGSGAPPTTGLRWLNLLERRDFVTRTVDPEDKRRTYVRLTDAGDAMMARCLAALAA